MMVVRWTDFGAWQRSMHDDQLLSEHHVLGGQGGLAAEQHSQEGPNQSHVRMHISMPPSLVPWPESYDEGLLLATAVTPL